jgi:hypothetical protein
VRSRFASALLGGGAMDAATILRRGVLALAGIGIAGTAVELIFLRHWATATATIVWIGMVALGAGFFVLVRHPSARRVRAVRVLAAIAVVIGIVGVAFHVLENLDAGPLDRFYATRWDTMSVLDQWWTAVTGGVGPAPTLAPGALAEISLALILATVHHPATLVRQTSSEPLL